MFSTFINTFFFIVYFSVVLLSSYLLHWICALYLKMCAVAIDLIVHHIRDTILQPNGHLNNSINHNYSFHNGLKTNGANGVLDEEDF